MQNEAGYKEDVVEMLAPEVTYTEFIAGYGTKIFPQKFEWQENIGGRLGQLCGDG